MTTHPSLDLMEFIETQILPRYADFDTAHGLLHVQRVIGRSLKLARQTGADLNMAYTVAAYHDLGLSGPRAIHHITSGKILINDARLKRWFSPDQMRVMREAVEDHRASASHVPRNIYGRIVAEADRDLEPEIVLRRTVQYGLSVYPEKNREEHWRRFCQHLHDKYSATGYIRLWLRNSASENHLQQLRSMIDNPSLLRQNFDRLFDEEKRLRQV